MTPASDRWRPATRDRTPRHHHSTRTVILDLPALPVSQRKRGGCALSERDASGSEHVSAITASPPPDWSVKRRLEYVAWARDVARGLRDTNPWLEEQFDDAATAADQSVRP